MSGVVQTEGPSSLLLGRRHPHAIQASRQHTYLAENKPGCFRVAAKVELHAALQESRKNKAGDASQGIWSDGAPYVSRCCQSCRRTAHAQLDVRPALAVGR